MILDERLEFADALSLASGFTSGAAHNLGDQIPLEVARDLGGGDGGAGQLYLVVQVVTDIISAGGAHTVQFALVSDDTASIHASTRSVHALSKVFVAAELLAGARVVLPVPPEASEEPYELFLGAQAVVGGENLTGGSVNAFLTRDVGSNKAYNSPSQYL